MFRFSCKVTPIIMSCVKQARLIKLTSARLGHLESHDCPKQNVIPLD